VVSQGSLGGSSDGPNDTGAVFSSTFSIVILPMPHTHIQDPLRCTVGSVSQELITSSASSCDSTLSVVQCPCIGMKGKRCT
jgi:hypothetical protein